MLKKEKTLILILFDLGELIYSLPVCKRTKTLTIDALLNLKDLIFYFLPRIISRCTIFSVLDCHKYFISIL